MSSNTFLNLIANGIRKKHVGKLAGWNPSFSVLIRHINMKSSEFHTFNKWNVPNTFTSNNVTLTCIHRNDRSCISKRKRKKRISILEGVQLLQNKSNNKKLIVAKRNYTTAVENVHEKEKSEVKKEIIKALDLSLKSSNSLMSNEAANNSNGINLEKNLITENVKFEFNNEQTKREPRSIETFETVTAALKKNLANLEKMERTKLYKKINNIKLKQTKISKPLSLEEIRNFQKELKRKLKNKTAIVKKSNVERRKHLYNSLNQMIYNDNYVSSRARNKAQIHPSPFLYTGPYGSNDNQFKMTSPNITNRKLNDENLLLNFKKEKLEEDLSSNKSNITVIDRNLTKFSEFAEEISKQKSFYYGQRDAKSDKSLETNIFLRRKIKKNQPPPSPFLYKKKTFFFKQVFIEKSLINLQIKPNLPINGNSPENKSLIKYSLDDELNIIGKGRRNYLEIVSNNVSSSKIVSLLGGLAKKCFSSYLKKYKQLAATSSLKSQNSDGENVESLDNIDKYVTNFKKYNKKSINDNETPFFIASPSYKKRDKLNNKITRISDNIISPDSVKSFVMDQLKSVLSKDKRKILSKKKRAKERTDFAIKPFSTTFRYGEASDLPLASRIIADDFLISQSQKNLNIEKIQMTHLKPVIIETVSPKYLQMFDLKKNLNMTFPELKILLNKITNLKNGNSNFNNFEIPLLITRSQVAMEKPNDETDKLYKLDFDSKENLNKILRDTATNKFMELTILNNDRSNVASENKPEAIRTEELRLASKQFFNSSSVPFFDNNAINQLISSVNVKNKNQNFLRNSLKKFSIVLNELLQFKNENSLNYKDENWKLFDKSNEITELNQNLSTDYDNSASIIFPYYSRKKLRGKLSKADGNIMENELKFTTNFSSRPNKVISSDLPLYFNSDKNKIQINKFEKMSTSTLLVAKNIEKTISIIKRRNKDFNFIEKRKRLYSNLKGINWKNLNFISKFNRISNVKPLLAEKVKFINSYNRNNKIISRKLNTSENLSLKEKLTVEIINSGNIKNFHLKSNQFNFSKEDDTFAKFYRYNESKLNSVEKTESTDTIINQPNKIFQYNEESSPEKLSKPTYPLPPSTPSTPQYSPPLSQSTPKCSSAEFLSSSKFPIQRQPSPINEKLPSPFVQFSLPHRHPYELLTTAKSPPPPYPKCIPPDTPSSISECPSTSKCSSQSPKSKFPPPSCPLTQQCSKTPLSTPSPFKINYKHFSKINSENSHFKNLSIDTQSSKIIKTPKESPKRCKEKVLIDKVPIKSAKRNSEIGNQIIKNPASYKKLTFRQKKFGKVENKECDYMPKNNVRSPLPNCLSIGKNSDKILKYEKFLPVQKTKFKFQLFSIETEKMQRILKESARLTDFKKRSSADTESNNCQSCYSDILSTIITDNLNQAQQL